MQTSSKNAQEKLQAIVNHDKRRPDTSGPVVPFGVLKSLKEWKNMRRVLVARLQGPIRGPA